MRNNHRPIPKPHYKTRQNSCNDCWPLISSWILTRRWRGSRREKIVLWQFLRRSRSDVRRFQRWWRWIGRGRAPWRRHRRTKLCPHEAVSCLTIKIYFLEQVYSLPDVFYLIRFWRAIEIVFMYVNYFVNSAGLLFRQGRSKEKSCYGWSKILRPSPTYC